MESPGVSRIAAEEAWESEVLPASEAAPAPAESEVAPASPEGEAVPEPAEERPSMLSRLASWRAPEPEPTHTPMTWTKLAYCSALLALLITIPCVLYPPSELADIVPAEPTAPYDTYQAIARLLDDSLFHEVLPHVGNEVIVDDSVAPAPDIAIDESSADVDLTMGNHFGGRRKKKKNRAGGDEIVMVPAQHHFRVIQMFLLS